MGVWVILFLVFLTFLAWLLKQRILAGRALSAARPRTGAPGRRIRAGVAAGGMRTRGRGDRQQGLAASMRPADSGRSERPMMAASPRMRNALTLFSSADDVLCHRVRLVLAAKGVTYDLVPVDPQNPPEDLIDLNPYHSVPTLVERDLVLYARQRGQRVPRRALSASAADAGRPAVARAPAPGDAAHRARLGAAGAGHPAGQQGPGRSRRASA